MNRIPVRNAPVKPQSQAKQHVPANSLTPFYQSNIGYKHEPCGPVYWQGHARSPKAKILPQAGLVLKRWDEVSDLLLGLSGSPKWAEMIREALRLQAWSGLSFASAAYLAEKALANEKTWDRCLRWLREQGLVASWRLHRTNGEQSTNLLDLTRLWEMLLQLLRRTVRAVERIGRRWWVKTYGAWVRASSLIPSEVGAGGGALSHT